jgi:methyl-accepting chemotaxis protein
MERTRNGPLPLVVPVLVVLPLVGLALWLSAARWFEADARAALTRRVADAASSAERLLDASVQRQVDATRALGTSPVAWLWVKFQGERLTPSNRSHAQAALDQVTSYAGLLPGVTVYLASERTRAVYQSGAAVAALSPSNPRDAWYPAALAAEGVIVADDPRQVRTSMRVMNGRELIGAVSCVGDISRIAAAALAGSDDERGFAFVLADREGSILISRGPQAGAAASVFDLFDPSERTRVKAAMDVVARPAGMTVDVFASKGKRVLTALTRTSAPGWYLLVSSEVPSLPAVRGAAIAGVTALALALLVAALLVIGISRSRSVQSVVSRLSRQRDEASTLAQKADADVRRLREAVEKLVGGAGKLEAETAAGREAAAETAALLGQADEQSAELRAGILARLSLFSQLSSRVREAADGARGVPTSAASVGSHAASAEEGLNRVITTGSAVGLALENASAAARGSVETAERARLLALNTALEASRPGGQRRVSPQAAEEMRRLAESAAQGAQELSAALEEARENLRSVSRVAQEAGASAHEAAAGCGEISGQVEASVRAMDETAARLESANASAQSLRDGAAMSDRARSAADGVTRILERISALCGEISAVAGEIDAAETAAGETAKEL